MSQATDLSPKESSAGDASTHKHSAIGFNEDIINFIQDWHVALRNKIMGVVASAETVSQSPGYDFTTSVSGHAIARSFGTSSVVVTPFSRSLHDRMSLYSIRYPGSTHSADLRTMDVPGLVQRTLAFMLSELHLCGEQFQQHITKERIKMKKHYAYLVQCHLTAEREKKAAQTMLSDAIATLEAAERERKRTENDRVIALQDLGLAIRRRRSSSVVEMSISRSFPSSCSDFSDSLMVSRDLPLVTANHRHCLLTPPKTPLGTDTECEPEPITYVEEGHSMSPGTTPDSNQEDHCPSSNDINFTFQPAKGDTLQNPIGPYIRAPMLVEDMQRCIRCLLGKDKSLKTGNRARAFLGVPWSEIVSWDPDTLLHRGVCGIKPGSTGMASRLRMMTIIESALANQGDRTITEEVWESPTYFCERCQQRYPITVRSDEVVPTGEEYEKQMRQYLINTETTNTDTYTQETKAKNTRRRKKPARY